MSTYREDSELSRFNASRSTDWFAVSDETAIVVELALEWGRRSSGAFDVTVGPLVDLWSFGPSPRAPLVPSAEDLAAARARVSLASLSVRREPPALRKELPDLSVDLSAIAKGYAVDAIAEYLSGEGVPQYLVEIGGEIRTRGARPGGGSWSVAIEKPQEETRAPWRILALGDRAIATSGDYRNYFEQDGRRYSHTIDPRTGEPVNHELAAVSVIRERCAEADALATALMVLGPDEGFAWAIDEDIAASFLVRRDAGFEVLETPRFLAWFGAAEAPSGEQASAAMPLQVLALTLVVFVLAVAAMSVGVIFSNRRIKGSCGGLAGLRDARGKPLCDGCADPGACPEYVEAQESAAREGRDSAAASGAGSTSRPVGS